jgi:CubicO group peptidase (beta-lactamase class C family)
MLLGRVLTALVGLTLHATRTTAAALPPTTNGGAFAASLAIWLSSSRVANCTIVATSTSSTTNDFSYAAAAAFTGPTPTLNSVFEIGSVTKVLVGVAAHALEIARPAAFSMDTPLSSFFPDVPFTSDVVAGITPRQLASHTSGLQRLPSNLDASNAQPYANYTTNDLLTYLKTLREKDLGPKRYCYSNTGVGLLGWIVMRAGGFRSVDAAIKALVTQPLGMTQTTMLPVAEMMPSHLSSGAEMPHWRWTNALVGAGGTRSSLHDLRIFASALLAAAARNDTLVSGGDENETAAVAVALARNATSNLSVATHTTKAKAKSKSTVATSTVTKRVVLEAMHAALQWEAPAARGGEGAMCPTGPLPPSPLRAGVTRGGFGTLFFKGQPVAWKNGEVAGTNAAIDLDFANNRAVVVIANVAPPPGFDVSIVARRANAGVPPPPRPCAVNAPGCVNNKTLHLFAGRFQASAKAVATVTVDADAAALAFQLPNQSALALIAESRTQFAFAKVAARMTFYDVDAAPLYPGQDGDGVDGVADNEGVSMLALSQNAMDTFFKRVD